MLYYIQHFNQMSQFTISKCFICDPLTDFHFSPIPYRNVKVIKQFHLRMINVKICIFEHNHNPTICSQIWTGLIDFLKSQYWSWENLYFSQTFFVHIRGWMFGWAYPNKYILGQLKFRYLSNPSPTLRK